MKEGGEGREKEDVHVWQDPVHGRLRAPSVPEQACWDEKASRNHDGDPELWFADAVVFLLEPAVQKVVQRRGDLCPEEETDAHGDEV